MKLMEMWAVIDGRGNFIREMERVEVRRAGMEDISELAVLMGELGYPATEEQMKSRLSNLEKLPGLYNLVADFEGEVVGMIGFHTGYLYTADSMYARVIALVVHSDHRSKGIGKLLLSKAEEALKTLGVSGIALNNGNRSEREAAHGFYERLGFKKKSTGFVKKLI
jgi:GNAT superfamily N-acetyltransferase